MDSPGFFLSSFFFFPACAAEYCIGVYIPLRNLVPPFLPRRGPNFFRTTLPANNHLIDVEPWQTTISVVVREFSSIGDYCSGRRIDIRITRIDAGQRFGSF